MPKNKAILYYFALTLYGFSANAAAQSCGGAPSGDVDGIWECIEYQDGTSNPYNAGPVGVWFGPAGTNSYTDTFNLETDLTLNYSFLTAQCPVTFETHFKRNSNNSLSIRVVNAYVYGTGMCNSISLSNFPWYASDTTSFSSTSSVDGAGNPGDIHPQGTGFTNFNLGNLEVGLFGSVVCTGYIEDVKFYNGNPASTPSSFLIDNNIVGTACGVSSTLKTIAHQDINVW
ncbi:hypothetical protein LL252_18540 [Alcanivorax marinus]|uniref:Uncharacterized protein n=1 Tax=Alloalcanivorax marinus TaxID=1177169 RepID=A0A9Q3URR2_9GAMM|nr:hypothetical protein [Alloalcanivorax marinus]MCC4310568.1 hypothetical protein [Alloalcanivorax marinus]